MLKEYKELHPGVHLRVSNHSTSQAISTLKIGSVDIAIVTTPTGELHNLKCETVKNIKEVAVCGTAFSRLSKEQITLADIAKLPIVSLGTHTKTYDFYTEWFLQHGILFTPDIEASTADQILPMVKNNLGIGFVPQRFLEDEDSNDVIILDLKERIPTRSICLIQKSDQALNIAAKELERMMLKQTHQ
ncbi:MAG: LysR family transcriptional regulator substrate-binding protein [Clostridia bacterium]|nr:LysR family transcriptional regulator substrate-binding protein [Clostridia bacterium]